MDERLALERLATFLSERTVVSGVAILPETEVFYDLHIYGDDLYGFIDWVQQQFGVDFSKMNCSDYAPAEGWLSLAKMFGLPIAHPQRYRALPVSKFLSAIAVGEWRD